MLNLMKFEMKKVKLSGYIKTSVIVNIVIAALLILSMIVTNSVIYYLCIRFTFTLYN